MTENELDVASRLLDKLRGYRRDRTRYQTLMSATLYFKGYSGSDLSDPKHVEAVRDALVATVGAQIAETTTDLLAMGVSCDE